MCTVNLLCSDLFVMITSLQTKNSCGFCYLLCVFCWQQSHIGNSSVKKYSIDQVSTLNLNKYAVFLLATRWLIIVFPPEMTDNGTEKWVTIYLCWLKNLNIKIILLWRGCTLKRSDECYCFSYTGLITWVNILIKFSFLVNCSLIVNLFFKLWKITALIVLCFYCVLFRVGTQCFFPEDRQ